MTTTALAAALTGCAASISPEVGVALLVAERAFLSRNDFSSFAGWFLTAAPTCAALAGRVSAMRSAWGMGKPGPRGAGWYIPE
jgi:hypothetical protein